MKGSLWSDELWFGGQHEWRGTVPSIQRKVLGEMRPVPLGGPP